MTAPHNKETTIDAIAEDSAVFLNEEIIKSLEVPQEYIEQEKQRQLDEILRRKSLYRIIDKTIAQDTETVILVDGGAATGATLIAAARCQAI